MLHLKELPCYDGRKSFYNKAQIMEHNGVVYLFSYGTPVARVFKDGEIERLWSGNSRTTSRHFKSFLIHLGMKPVKFSDI